MCVRGERCSYSFVARSRPSLTGRLAHALLQAARSCLAWHVSRPGAAQAPASSCRAHWSNSKKGFWRGFCEIALHLRESILLHLTSGRHPTHPNNKQAHNKQPPGLGYVPGSGSHSPANQQPELCLSPVDTAGHELQWTPDLVEACDRENQRHPALPRQWPAPPVRFSPQGERCMCASQTRAAP